MNAQVSLLKLQHEQISLENCQRVLEDKTDRTSDESKEIETLDTKIKEVREKVLKANDAAIAESEAEIVERQSSTPENREKLELRSHKENTLGYAISQRLSGRDAFDGAFGEYVSACGTKANEVPLEYFAKVRREERAVSTAPSAEAVSTTTPTIGYEFAPPAATSLGVQLRPTPSGESHHVVVTTAPPAAPKAASGTLPSTAAALTLTKRTPKRIGGQVEIEIESEALFPSLGPDLDISIAGSLGDKIDDQILTGSSSGANLDGLVNQADNVTVASSLETFQSGVTRWAGLLEGTHASQWADVRALIGVPTFALYASLFAASSDISLFDYLKSRLGSLMVSSRVPAKSGSGQKAIATLMGKAQPIVVDVWNSLPMRIDESVTKAGEGIRIVTLFALIGSPFIPYGSDQVVELHPKIS